MPDEPQEIVIVNTLDGTHRIASLTDDTAAYMIRVWGESGDHEAAHSCADDLLCRILERLGYTETVKAYNELTRWCA